MPHWLRHAALPSGEDGRGRESRIDALARASGRAATATRGRLFCFGNERAKPLAFPLNPRTKPIRLPQPQRGTGNGTLARRDAGGRRVGKQSADKAVAPSAQRRQSKRTRVRRSHGKERGKSASGSAQRRRAFRSAQRGTERVPKISRSFSGRPSPCASDRHRQAETPQAARWSEPAQTGLRNKARSGLARRR